MQIYCSHDCVKLIVNWSNSIPYFSRMCPVDPEIAYVQILVLHPWFV